jgi:hypothetical protein
MNKETILVFIIQAYQNEAPDGSLADIVTLELIDKNPENALKRAKTMVVKKFYRLSKVVETYAKT